MGWWWPFSKSNSTTEDSSRLDADLQKYYDDVVAKGRQTSNADTKVAGEPNVTRMRPVTDPRSNEKSLKQIAMDNCVEYEKAYSTCLLQGSYAERLGGCPHQLSMYEHCQGMQADALTVLGFLAAQSDLEKSAIKARADDLMIATVPTLSITEAQETAFTKSLDSIRSQGTN